MGKDYPGIQRLKKDGSNWHQYWTQLSTYLRGEGLLHIIREGAGPPPYPKLQEEKPTIPIDQIPEDADKEERDEILEKSQIIADTNDSIRSTNKALTDEHEKKLDQYDKDDGGLTARQGHGKVERGHRWGSAKVERGHRWRHRKKAGRVTLLAIQNAYQ